MPEMLAQTINRALRAVPWWDRLGLSTAGSLRARFLSGAFWSVVGAVLSRGLTLLSSLIAGRLLGATHFGELAIIQSTIGLFGVFAGVGLGLTATKHVAQYRLTDPVRAGRYISLSVRISCIAGAAVAGVMLILAPRLAPTVLGSAGLTPDLRWASGLVLFGAVNGVQTGVMAGLEEFRLIAVMTTVRAAALITSLTAGAVGFGLEGAVAGLTIAEALSAIANHRALHDVSRKHALPVAYWSADWSDHASLWRFAFPALLASTITMPAIWGSNLILVHQPHGFTAMGIYSAADRWRLVLTFLPSSLAAMVLPMLSSLHGTENANGFRRVVRATVVVNLVVVLLPAALLALFAGQAMAAYGPGYAAGSWVLVVLTASAVGSVFNTALGQILVSQGKIWARFAYDAVLAVLLFGSAYLLVPRAGAMGLAWANVVAFGAVALGLAVHVRFQTRRQDEGI